MATYPINHLRVRAGIPREEGLAHLEQVDGAGPDFTPAGCAKRTRPAVAAAPDDVS